MAAAALRSGTKKVSDARAASLFLLCASVLPGCVTGESWVHSMKPAAPAAAVSEVTAIWKGLAVTQDAVNGGQALPGIAGRLYLFGPDLGVPVLRAGKLQVDLYDATQAAQGKDAVLLERWNLDAETLGRLARKDNIGEGYTLFLPWKTYRRDITQVQMKVAFTPTDSRPVYAAPTLVTLRPAVPIAVEERQVVSTPENPRPTTALGTMLGN